jgi:hypothetical protein
VRDLWRQNFVFVLLHLRGFEMENGFGSEREELGRLWLRVVDVFVVRSEKLIGMVIV